MFVIHFKAFVFLTDGRFKMDDFDIGGCFETGDLDLEDCGSASVKLTHVTASLVEERASRAVNDWVCQDPGENLGIFHQVQVINAMLGSICGIANEMLLLGFPCTKRPSLVRSPTKMQSEMETEPKSFPVPLTARATTPRLEVALDRISHFFTPSKIFWAQCFLISSALLGFDMANRERSTEACASTL